MLLPALACFAIVVLLVASVERRVWESSADDNRTGTLLKSEANGKVVGLLVELDRVDIPGIPGIDVAPERQRPALPLGVPPRVALRGPATRAPPLGARSSG